METIDFLRDLAIVLVAAGLVAVLFHRLRWPIVAGYLLAGLAVGPHLPPALISDASSIRLLSELGVILLMFSVGLDFRIRDLLRAASTAGVTAAVEVGLMLALGFSLGRLLGWSPLASLFAAGTMAISSTMIVARVFREQGVTGRLRETVLGTLIFEDLAAMLLIAILTGAAAGRDLSGPAVGMLILRLVVVVGLFFALGMLLVPRAVRLVAQLGHEEVLVVSGVGLCFGLAWLAHLLGFSVALGAFLAGQLVAESGFGQTLEAKVHPLRDVFAAIFFVAVGMQLDPLLLGRSWGAAALFLATVLVGKTCGVSLGVFLAGRGAREAVQAGLSLAQVGEFSFIIAGVGIQAGAAPELLGSIAISVSVMTASLAPSLIRRSGSVAAWIDRRLPHRVQTFASLYGSWAESLHRAALQHTPWHRVRAALPWLLLDWVAITGLVIFSGLLRTPLRAGALAVGLHGTATDLVVTGVLGALVAPFLFGLVQVARRLGGELAGLAVPLPVAGRVDNGRAPRKALAAALQIGLLLVVGAPLVVITAPFLPGSFGVMIFLAILTLLGVAFWRAAQDLLGHFRAGAELVVATLAKQSRTDQVHFEVVRRMLPGLGDFEPVRVAAASESCGRTLGEVNLRGRTGATVIALLRGEERVVFPEAGTRLDAGDLLALTGSHDAMRAATELLQQAPGASG